MLQPIVSIQNLIKKRPQEQGMAYTLSVPLLDVLPKEKILITGPSGCGKSTLLDLLGMVLRPDAIGSFFFCPWASLVSSSTKENSKSIPAATEQTLPPAHETDMQHNHSQPYDVAQAWLDEKTEDLALWRRNIGYVLQTGGLLPFVSVHENILIPRKLLGIKEDGFTESLVKRIGISHLLKKLPSQLSVGERQRVAIARALSSHPALVLADEPTAALDPANAATILDLFTEMVDSLGVTLILVSHAPEQVKGNFRRLVVSLSSQDEHNHHAILKEAGGNA